MTIAKGVRMVPQGHGMDRRTLGKYHGALKPGLNIVIPLSRQGRLIGDQDIILDVHEQEVITRDNAVILTNAIAFIKVTDPVKAVYGVTDFQAIRNLIMTTLRSIVGGNGTRQRRCRHARQDQARLRESIADRRRWTGPDRQVGRDPGHQAVTVDAEAMELQAAAEREQGRRHPRRGAKEVGHPRSRSPARIGQTRRQRPGHARRSLGRAIRRIHRRHRRPDQPDVLPARRKYIAALERMGEKEENARSSSCRRICRGNGKGLFRAGQGLSER